MPKQPAPRRKRGCKSLQKADGSSSSRTNSQSSNTRSTKSTSPYDRAFQQHLIDHNIVPHRYRYPDGTIPPAPDNLKEILKALTRERASLSPSRFPEESFDEFEQADAHARKECDISAGVIPHIEGKLKDPRCVAGQIPFTNLDVLTDGTLVPGNPDRYYGAQPEQLQREIRDVLSGQIVPSTQKGLPLAPNFVLQVKGPDGTAAVASRQACYDGAIAARGIRSLQTYQQPASMHVHDRNAYTLSATYQDGQLRMYAVHPIVSPELGAPVGYVLTHLRAFSMISDVETFRAGAAAYRNGRDWAKKQRDEAVRLANACHRRLTGEAAAAAIGAATSSNRSKL